MPSTPITSVPPPPCPNPLGRTGANGKVISVQQGSLGSTFLGFTNLYTYWDSSGGGIYHSAYVSFTRRAAKGLTFSSNYTFGKSIDDASDASPEANVLSTPTTIGGGQANFGGTPALDRSVPPSTSSTTSSPVRSMICRLGEVGLISRTSLAW